MPTFAQFQEWFRRQPIPYQHRRELQAGFTPKGPNPGSVKLARMVFEYGEAIKDCVNAS